MFDLASIYFLYQTAAQNVAAVGSVLILSLWITALGSWTIKKCGS